MRAQPLRFLRRSSRQVLIDDRSEKAERDDQDRDHCHRNGEPFRSHHLIGNGNQRIGTETDRRHGAEVQPANRDREQQRAAELMAQIGLAPHRPQRDGADDDTDRQRNRDEVFRPIHLGRNDHRLHADIVHGADRHAEHGAARGHGAETKRRREAKPGDRHGGADRDQRQGAMRLLAV